jgi:hypothetical protein
LLMATLNGTAGTDGNERTRGAISIDILIDQAIKIFSANYEVAPVTSNGNPLRLSHHRLSVGYGNLIATVNHFIQRYNPEIMARREITGTRLGFEYSYFCSKLVATHIIHLLDRKHFEDVRDILDNVLHVISPEEHKLHGFQKTLHDLILHRKKTNLALSETTGMLLDLLENPCALNSTWNAIRRITRKVSTCGRGNRPKSLKELVELAMSNSTSTVRRANTVSTTWTPVVTTSRPRASSLNRNLRRRARRNNTRRMRRA